MRLSYIHSVDKCSVVQKQRNTCTSSMWQSMLLLPVLASYFYFQPLAIPCTCNAWVPPPPHKRHEFEPVHDMRRRLGQPFNFSTTLVHPEVCRYYSEADCEAAESNFKRHVEAHKKLQKQVRSNPNTGTINVLVLMVRFKNHQNRDCELCAFWAGDYCGFLFILPTNY